MKWVISIVMALISLLYFASLFALPIEINSNNNVTDIVITSVHTASKVTKYMVHTTAACICTVLLAAVYIFFFTMHACGNLELAVHNDIKSIDSLTKEAYGIHALEQGEMHGKEKSYN